jgi:hypothetical protein
MLHEERPADNGTAPDDGVKQVVCYIGQPQMATIERCCIISAVHCAAADFYFAFLFCKPF